MENQNKKQEENAGLNLLNNPKIRRTLYEGKVYYAIPDLVKVLIEKEEKEDMTGL